MKTRKKSKSLQFGKKIRIIYISSTNERYGCPLCDEDFADRSGVYRHFRQAHPKEIRWIECPYCPRVFMSKPGRKRHVSTAHPTSANNEPSEVVPVANSDSTRTNRTKIIDAGSNNLYCDYCPKTLRRPLCKEVHERVHTGERCFACKYCPATFFYKSTCKNHELDCRHLDTAVWCRFCNFYVLDRDKLRLRLENHYKRMHGLKFENDEEVNFFEREINDALNNGTNNIEGDDKTTEEYETLVSQSGPNLEESFPNYDAVSNANEPSVGEIQIPRTNNENEAFRNSERAEGITVAFFKKSCDPRKRKTEVERLTENVGKIIPNDSDSNSVVIEDAGAENVTIKGNESFVNDTQNLFSNSIIQDDILEHFDDSMIRENSTIAISKGVQRYNRYVETTQIRNISTSVPQCCFENDCPLHRRNSAIAAPTVDVQVEQGAMNSQPNESCREIPTLPCIKFDFSSSETNTEPVLPQQVIRNEMEVAQLNSNFKEICCENYESLASSLKDEPDIPLIVCNIDLTLSSDEEL